MRLSRTKSRLASAGLTAGAVVAALLVAPSAAYAVALDSLSPVSGAVGTTVTATKTGGFTGDNAGAVFTTGTCPSTYNVTAPNIAAGAPNKLSANAATFTVPTLALGASGAVKAYNFCAYVGTVVGTSAVINDTAATFTLTPAAAITPNSGPSGGGNTITATLPTSAAVIPATPGVNFSSTGCTLTYGASPTNPSTTVTRTSTTVLTATVPATVLGTGLTTPYHVCIYGGVATGSALLAASFPAYNVTLPSTTLNSTIGPVSTVQNPVNLTVTGSTNLFTGVTSPAAVLLASPTASPATCSALYPSSPTLTAALRKTANNKAAFTVPTGATVSNSLPTPYIICMYSSTSTTTGKLLSVATYTVANVPTIASVSPNSGPALGGSTITVSGSNFPTAAGAITATLGGAALTSITPIDANTFTAVTPAHSTGATTLSVSSSSGSDNLAGAFTYVNSVAVTPNTAPNSSTAQDVNIQGTGFVDYVFSGTANTGAHVYLVDGDYNDRAATGASTIKANGPLADCTSVLVISDSELVCSLNLTAALDPTGATLTPQGYRTGTATTTTSNVITLTAGTTFNANDVGEPIVQAANTNIPAGTTIVSVLTPTTAIMSAAATAATGITVTIGYQATGLTITTGTNGASTVTGAAGLFTQADVGRYATGTNVGTNAVVTAVDPTGATATLSVANSGAVTSVTLTSGNPVPNGAYNLTVVSNAAVGASASDSGYKETIISSTSTFTVAPF